MRSSKGTAQFLLIAFIILVALAVITAKDANRKHPGAGKQTVQAAMQSNNDDDDE